MNLNLKYCRQLKMTAMEKLLTLLVCITFFSCTRDSPDTQNRPTESPEISFDVNGIHYVYSGQAKTINSEVGVYAYKKIYDPYLREPDASRPHYNFVGYKDIRNSVGIYIVNVDSLKTTTYSYNSQQCCIVTIRVEIENKGYSSIGVNDHFDLEITGYEKGIVNGKFSGTAVSDGSPSLNIPPITITNGVLKNVKLVYWPK